MKTTVFRNIDLVQINLVAGVSDYYLPKNVAWNGKKIEQLIICAPASPCVSPIDGTTDVLERGDIQDCYVSLYDNDGNEVVRDLSFEQLLHTNNERVRIDRVLNLELCRVRFTTPPAQSAVLLIYAVYGSEEVEDYELPSRSVSCRFTLYAGSEISFREMINLYIHALPSRVRSITFYDAENNPAYVVMRDHQLTYSINNVHTELARPQVYMGNTAENVQKHTLYLDDLDIDFDYSRIYNPTTTDNVQTIEFGY